MRYTKCVCGPVEDFPINRKNEERVDWKFVFAFAWGHMVALNMEIKLWGL